MNSFYLNQSNARIELDTFKPLTDVTAAKIKFIKPDKSEGEWTAVINGTVIYYNCHQVSSGKSELDQLGKWIIWTFVTYTDGRTSPGDADILMVIKEGQIIS